MIPLFSTGLPRSGTNVLTKALSVHNDIMLAMGPNIEIYRYHRDAVVRRHGSKELQLSIKQGSPIQDYYGADCKIELLDLMLNSSLSEEFEPNEWETFYNAAITRYDHDSSDLLTGYTSLKSRDYIGIIKNLLNVIGNLRTSGHKKWIGAHESWNIDSFPALARDFPSAKFLIVLRDPRAVFNSLFAQAKDRPQLRAQILSYSRHFRKYVVLTHKFQREALFKGRLFVLRHEDLLQNPESVLQKICGFLDLQFDERMLDTNNYYDFATRGTWKGNSAFDKIVTGFDPQRSVRWKQTLPEITAKAIEYLCFNEMKLAGYNADHHVETLNHVEIINHLIEHDYHLPVKWRTDLGVPMWDLSLEEMRHILLRSTTKVRDGMFLRACFLFEEFSDYSRIIPLNLM